MKFEEIEANQRPQNMYEKADVLYVFQGSHMVKLDRERYGLQPVACHPFEFYHDMHRLHQDVLGQQKKDNEEKQHKSEALIATMCRCTPKRDPCNRSSTDHQAMEAIQGSISIQEKVVDDIVEHYLQPMEKYISHLGAGKITLAVLARQFRLNRLVEIFSDMINLEIHLMKWYTGSEEVPTTHVNNQVHKVVPKIEEETSNIHKQWSGPTMTVPEHRFGKSVESKIARLHGSIEIILLYLSGLTKSILKSGMRIPAELRNEINMSVIDFLRQGLPQKYVLSKHSITPSFAEADKKKDAKKAKQLAHPK